ncbi:glycosyl hydrolase [Naumannella halotolerans]|uniref:glucan endo-1,3-beta-D-glucosidase n=1 Tax=Naumannella halotolerans TaxID=993414 RepID=A0A4R7JBQ9_9ACTN|nr:glycosyl hydrolase [Naumannella halotolerans]TDT34053.1 endoglucanase Acf2 [Naumannella halotolerans]
MSRLRGAIPVLVICLLATACTPGAPDPDGGGTGRPSGELGDRAMDESVVEPLVEAQTQESLGGLPASRLADGVAPATNRWYSGLVYGEQPMAVYPVPMSFGLTAEGFGLGLPPVTTTADLIAGSHTPAITVGTGAAAATVTEHDEFIVKIAVTGERAVGTVQLTRGSPFITWTADEAGTLTVDGAPTEVADGVWETTVAGSRYGMAITDGSLDGSSVTIDQGGVIGWWPVPEGAETTALAQAATSPVTDVELHRERDGEELITTLDYVTDSGSTAYVVEPHQRTGGAGGDQECISAAYASVTGTLALCTGSRLSWRTPVIDVVTDLDLDSLDDADRELLIETVKADAAAVPEFPADSYFGGKALQREAQLLNLASGLELTAEADTIRARLREQLLLWAEQQGCASRAERCFVYDPEAKGMIGQVTAFGSEQFNDHHFHYGHFLYAAAILLLYEPELRDQLSPVMDLLAADIATSEANDSFPQRRVFDTYMGHSWASGTAPFGDGNNQESISEAVNAWTGLALWARASENTDLLDEAEWLLSLEAASGLQYWTDIDLSDPVYSGYDHDIVSLNWSGKREYATWFSPEPAAKLGILLIPLNPSMSYLATDPERIRQRVDEASAAGFDQAFGDYLLMYLAMAGGEDRERAIAEATSLPEEFLDDGNSRSYLLAWILTQP